MLAFFDAHNAAAMRCQGRGLWAADIRNNPDLATRFLKDWADEQRNDKLQAALDLPDGQAGFLVLRANR